MKSTIKIDFNLHLEPVIAVHKVLTDDLRDKYLSIFFEQLAGNSNLAFISVAGSWGKQIPNADNKWDEGPIYNIHPIPGNREGLKKYLSQCCGEQVKMIAEVCQELVKSYPTSVDND